MTYLEQRRKFIEDGRPLKQKVRKPIAKMSAKRKLKMVDDKILFEQDKVFYKEVWLASKHECQACGAKLPKEPLTLFFHHLLPKAIYPQFRHTFENIMVLCPDCHSQVEMDADKVTGARGRQEEARRVLLGKTD
jgi:5-methylcytosine-specific restriction endonuclease McrA